MMTEIEVEGIGIMRRLNSWQYDRIKRIADKANRGIALVAFGLGLTVRQFKDLSPELQEAAHEEHNRLYAPDAAAQPPYTQRPRLPRPREHVSIERQIELGKQLLQVKAKLPHGHFRPWVEDQSGITYAQAQRWMKVAKEKGVSMPPTPLPDVDRHKSSACIVLAAVA